MTENDISRIVIDAAIKVHRHIGPGLLETVYESILTYELEERRLKVARQVPVPIHYRHICLDEGFRADLVVEDKLIIELKSVESLARVHKKQLLTYLRMSELRLGVLLNFGAPLIKEGICRVANGIEDIRNKI